MKSKISESRYERHCILPYVGEEGQRKFNKSKVLIVGAGGLASSVALYLAASGIGTIGIADSDVVSLSNLQRQILYEEQDLQEKKVIAAKKRLSKLNSSITVIAIDEEISQQNASKIFPQFDIIVDATDNYRSRYAISDECVRQKKYDVFGAVNEWYGQVVVLGKSGPCLRCLSPFRGEQEENATPRGIIAPLAGIVGSFQALEVLKIILEKENIGKMLFIDGLTFDVSSSCFKKNKKCKFCSL